QRNPPLAAVDAEVDKVATSDRQDAVDIAALGHIADVGIASMRPLAKTLETPRSRRKKAEQQPQQGGLPTPIGAQDGDEFSGVHREARVSPDEPVSVGRGQAIGDDGGIARSGHAAGHCRLSAACREVSCLVCQSWKEAVAGSTVSEIPTTGIPFCAASC